MFEFVAGVLLAMALVIVFDVFFEWRKRVKWRAVVRRRPSASILEHGEKAA
jgi:hypothetical protein